MAGPLGFLLPRLPGHAGSSWARGRSHGVWQLWDSAATPLLHWTGHHCPSQLAWPSCSHQCCPTPSVSSAVQGSPSSCSEPSSLPGFPSLHPCRRLTHPTRAILQTAAPQLFPSLSPITILVNQRCSLLLWFDSKFSHFLLGRVRVTYTAHTSGKLYGHWLADEEGSRSLHSSKGNRLPLSDPGNTRIQFVPKAAKEVGFISHSPTSFLPQTQFNFV